MIVSVSKKSGGDTTYNNVKSISTGVRFKNGEPIYMISLTQQNHDDEITVKDISGFEVYQADLTWTNDGADIICPHCGQHFDKKIIDVVHGEFMKFCPKCGKTVDYDSYVHDKVKRV